MSDSTEYETEKEGYSTNTARSTQVRSKVKQSSDSIELTDLVNDATLAKSNITYVIDSPDTNHYGTQYVQLPVSNDEKNYQIRLMSTPKTHNVYYGESDGDNMKYETLVMIVMLILVLITAILLTMVINTSEKNAKQDDIIVYNMTADLINSDPILRQFRSMSTI